MGNNTTSLKVLDKKGRCWFLNVFLIIDNDFESFYSKYMNRNSEVSKFCSVLYVDNI